MYDNLRLRTCGGTILMGNMETLKNLGITSSIILKIAVTAEKVIFYFLFFLLTNYKDEKNMRL